MNIMALPKKSSKKIQSTLKRLDNLKSPVAPRFSPSKEKLTILLTRELHERLQLALPKIKIDFKKQNRKIDKSSLIEQAVKDWLDMHKY